MTRNPIALNVVLLRIAFFACLALLVILSWLPASEMVRTGISGRIEHGVAYFGTAAVMALAYRETPRLLVQVALLVALAAVLEVGQLYVPGRNSAFLDFASSSTGAALAGLLMAAARPRLLRVLGPDRTTLGR